MMYSATLMYACSTRVSALTGSTSELTGLFEVRTGQRPRQAKRGNWPGDAAVQTFVAGIWIACIFSCHVVCEREVAGVLAMLPDDAKAKSWGSFGLGRLLSEVERHRLLPPDLLADVRQVADVRKPYGHWRSAIHEEFLMSRVRVESEWTGNENYANLAQRLVIRDATQAMDTAIRLHFGSYALGGP